MSKVTGKIIEDYSLQEMLGEGVYGKVYKAINVKTKQQVAIKVVRAEKFKEIPKLEEFTVNQINTLTNMEPNQHIVKYYDMLKTVNNFYFVYEYCNGGTLDKILQTYKNSPEKVIPQKKALLYFRQIVEAFKTLTKNNIMHRDLKPDNILLHNGIVKLADFGFCKSLGSPTQMAQTMLGSPIYMAPEVLKGQIYTMKADIWSLGVVLYQMLTNQCPFQSNSIAKLIQILDTHQLNFPPNISAGVQRLLKRMLVKDHIKRIDWNELFQYKITDTGDLIQPKSAILNNKNLTTSFGGFGYNNIVSSIQQQNNTLSASNNMKGQNSMLSKNGSFDSGGFNQYQANMMRRKSPIKDIGGKQEETVNNKFGQFYVPQKKQNQTSNNLNTSIGSKNQSLSDISNQKYDQMVKSHKKIISVVQLGMDVIGPKTNKQNCSSICYLIMKTVQKQLGELAQGLRKEVELLNSFNSSNPFAVFRTMVQKQLQGLQNFMKILREDIEKNGDKVNNIINQRDRYVKSYIQSMKLDTDPDLSNFIHASQVLDYFEQAILLKKDTYQRLTREQLFKHITTKISRL